MRLKDTVCVVTGASSGIGLACAAALRAEGGRVIGIALEGAADAEPPILGADVSDAGSIDRAVAADLFVRGDISPPVVDRQMSLEQAVGPDFANVVVGVDNFDPRIDREISGGHDVRALDRDRHLDRLVGV